MPDALTLVALRALVGFSEPRVSPDGARLAYVRTVRDVGRDRNVAALVVSALDGSGRRTLETAEGLGSPRWSPDGASLAYLRAVRGAEQIVVRRAGAAARVVTSAPLGVQHFAWSPDGRRFAYVTPDAAANAAAAARNDDLFDLGNDGMRTVAPPAPSHLWLVARAGGPATRLTHGAWSVYEGVPPFAGGPADPSWSPDGRTLLIARAPDAHDADSDRTAIAAVDVATGDVRDLGTLRQNVYAPAFAPSGRAYAYTRPHGPGPIGVTQLVVASASGGDGTVRGGALDADINGFRWSGDSLVATATDHLRNVVVRIAPDGTVQRAPTGDLSVDEIDVAPGGALVMVASAYDRPPEVYVQPPGASAPRAITNDNAALRARSAAREEAVQWTAPDGTVSEGILVHPLHETPGRRYPLLIWNHGGPESASLLSYTNNNPENYPVGALASAAGWFAFLPNYRGSDDLGDAHEHLIFRDPAAGPMTDVMAGLAEIERRFAIDPARECIAGRSYGGYLTGWIIAHDRRFRCAAIVDGALDWRAGYDLSAAGNLAFTRDSLGGSPWRPEAADLYRDTSPLTFAAEVRTPTLLVTGLADDVVPYTESFEFYHALRDNGVPVRLVGIPTAHHHPSDPVRLESYQRTLYAYLRSQLR